MSEWGLAIKIPQDINFRVGSVNFGCCSKLALSVYIDESSLMEY